MHCNLFYYTRKQQERYAIKLDPKSVELEKTNQVLEDMEHHQDNVDQSRAIWNDVYLEEYASSDEGGWDSSASDYL